MARKMILLVALFVLVLIAGVFSILRWPELVLNDRSLEFTRRYLGERGIADLSWKKADLVVISESLLRKRLRLTLQEVCFQQRDVVRACFKEFAAEALVDLSRFPPGLVEVGPVRADDGAFKLSQIALSGSASIQGKAAARLEELRLDVRSAARLDSGALKVRAQVNGQAGLRTLRARLTGRATGLLPGELEFRDCALTAERKARGGSFFADCPFTGALPVELTRGPIGLLKLPKTIGVRLLADLETRSFPPDPAERAVGRVEAKLEPVRSRLYELEGGAVARVDAVPLEIPSSGEIEANADVKLVVRRFESLVKELESGPWAIWAPLRNLTGMLELGASGKVDMGGGTIPLRLTTRLKSPSQRLDLDATGTFEVEDLRGNTRSRADIDVVLSDVQLELPRLDLAAPPRLLPDSRVARTGGASQSAGRADEGPPLNYRIRLRTPTDRAARLLSNLARAPIPLGIDVAFERDRPIEGKIAIRSFPVKFFNREATIDHFNVDLTAPETESPIDGMVRFDLTDYQFRVLTSGTLGKPGFAFESDPPLSQSQILSVLIYGRPADELDSEESATVGNTEAAVRDQAIGLASFFILGSTPIQGLAYDPKTKALQVKFRVAEGTTLNVGGSPGDLRDIGLRRRLGKGWSITTDLSKGSADSNVLSAFLEWAHRY